MNDHACFQGWLTVGWRRIYCSTAAWVAPVPGGNGRGVARHKHACAVAKVHYVTLTQAVRLALLAIILADDTVIQQGAIQAAHISLHTDTFQAMFAMGSTTLVVERCAQGKDQHTAI